MKQGRALLLFALLLASGLAGLAGPASAQSNTAICFDKDPSPASAGSIGGTPLGAQSCKVESPPPYLQGDSVTIRLTGFAPGTVSQVKVRCVSGCPTGDPSATAEYFADYAGSALVFPRDFDKPRTGSDPALARNAERDRAPRYNSTWEVTALVGATPSLSRNFAVWAGDFYDAEEGKIRPGSIQRIRLAGFDGNAEVEMRIERRVGGPNGAYELMEKPTKQRVPLSGAFTTVVHFPKTEAKHITACAGATDCYRLVARGVGKLEEVVHLRMAPAEVRRNDATSEAPPQQPQPLERTRDVVVLFDLMYPPGGNGAVAGAPFAWDDAPLAFNGKHELRVVVEKQYVNDTSKNHTIAELNATYDNASLDWRTNWTPPKDLPIENGAVYRMRLLPITDVHGNRIRDTLLGHWTITRASIRPLIAPVPEKVERTQEVNVTVLLRYLDGTNLSTTDLNGTLRGCFVQASDVPVNSPSPCTGVQVAEAKAWGNGTWTFLTRYGRDDTRLTMHRFHLLGGLKDAHGNDLLDAQTRPYELVPAKPLIDFTTVVGGVDEKVLERGDLVFINAVIKYADGNAYNHSLRYRDPATDPTILQAKLTKRGPAATGETYGPVVSVENLELREVDPYNGRWAGRIQLTDDDAVTPAGRWSIEVNATDNLTVPNGNVTVFDRRVVGAQIFVCDLFPKGSTTTPYFTGTQLRWRYRLEYEGCGMGRPVPAPRLHAITAHVHRFSTETADIIGPPVSGVLVPRFDAATGEWVIEYTIERHLFNGTYAVALAGEDTYHNPLARASVFPEFSTRAPAKLREVLTQPPAQVFRGEMATVIFAAQPGDTGVDPNRPVRVQLERYFPRGPVAGTCAPAPEGGLWCGEALDLLADGYEDHVGLYPVRYDTPVGIYRFALQGRDKDFNIITAVSHTFSIEPTSVARVLFSSPPPQVLKGERLWFTAELQPGDRYNITGAKVVFNGRDTSIEGVRLEPRLDTLNVSWTVPYDLPPGNYSIRVEGRDLTGNKIEIESPPFEASALGLSGRIIGSPAKVVKRGDTANFIFGVTYPNGAFYLSPASPTVTVLGPEGFSTPATIRREGLTIIATWRMPANAPDGEYHFKVGGEAAAGNLFPDLESPAFRPAPGQVTRRMIGDVVDLYRMGVDVVRIPRSTDDKEAECKLAYYGDSVSDYAIFLGRAQPQSTSVIPHIVDPASRTYACTLLTDANTPLGKYRVIFEGVDAHDNVITAQSRAFSVHPASAVVAWDPFPSDDAFGPGKTIKISFTVRYTTGLSMTGDDGMPGAILKYNNAPVQPKPNVTYEGGRYVITWTAPDRLPPGPYVFTVAGADNAGNGISASSTNTYYVRAEVADSLAAVAEQKIPGAPVGLVVALLAVLAVVLGRRRSR